MSQVKSIEFTSPFLILVEGPGDKTFFEHLIKNRDVSDVFHIHCPSDAEGVDSSGNLRFKDFLNAIAVAPGFDDLKEIIVVIDNDDEPKKSFVQVQKQIEETQRGYKAPKIPLEKTGGKPQFCIMPIPWIDEPGNLETLCLVSAEEKYPDLANCADKFQNCTGVDKWPLSKRSKVKLRSILSAGYQRNGDIGLENLWKASNDLIPLNHKCFDRIVEFLRTYQTWNAAPS